MAKKIEAFRLSGRVEIDERGAKRALQSVEAQAKQTQGVFGKLKSALMGGGSSGGGGFLPGLSYISEIIQGLPQIGALAGALVRPLTDAGQEGIKFNMMLDDARSGFEGIAGSANGAASHVKALQKLANDKRVPFEGVLQAAQAMNIYNFSLEEQLTKMPIWMEAIAAGGRVSAEAVEGVARAFGQMKAKGTVSAEEMEQLAERGVDGWNLLAKSIGLTVGETRKLSEQGRLNGRIAVDLMTEMIALDTRYQGQLDRRGKKLSGQLDLLANITAAGKGQATENLSKDLSETLEEGLKIAPLAQYKIAGSINAAIKPVSGMIKNTAKFALGGGLSEGFTEGINAGQELVKQAIADMAENAAIAPFKNLLGIQSPSTVFYYFGQMSAQGFANGFNDEFEKFKDSLDLDGFYNTKGKRRVRIERDPNAPEGLTGKQYQNWLNLQRLQKQDPNFIPTLKRLSSQHGVNPDWMLNLMAIESSFNKNVVNRFGYGGLGQVGRSERGRLGLPVGDAAFRKLLQANSASWQLENVVFPFLELKNKENLKAGGIKSSMARLYAAWGSGHVKESDQGIHMAAKAAGANFNRRTRAYFNNPQWDWNKDGYVQQWEFGNAANAKLGAGEKFTVTNGALNVNVVGINTDGGRDPFVNPTTKTEPRIIGGLAGLDQFKEVAALPQAKIELKEIMKLVPLVGDKIARLEPPLKTTSLEFDNLDTEAKGLAESTKEAAKQVSKLTKEQIKANRRRLFGTPPGIFTKEKREVRDEEGNVIDNPSKLQSAMGGLKSAFADLKGMGKEALGQFAQGIGGIAENFVLMGETGPAALRKLTAQVLASLTAQAAMKAVFYMAEGFAALARWDFASATNWFTSAGIMAGVAGLAALGGRKAAGNLFNGKDQNQNQESSDQSQQGGDFTRRAFGGQVFAGRSYIINDANRTQAEVFTPNQNGYIYPSVKDYMRNHSSGGSSSGNSESVQIARELKEALMSLTSIKKGVLVKEGLKKNKGLVSRAMINDLGSRQGDSMEVNRRLGFAR